MLHWYFTLVMAALNLKTLIQATELTENTEKETGFLVLPGHQKGESQFRENRLLFLCDLCVLCG